MTTPGTLLVRSISRFLSIGLFTFAITACVLQANPGYESPQGPVVVTQQRANRLGGETIALERKIVGRATDDEHIESFLNHANSLGARHVSGITLVRHLIRLGRLSQCRTFIGPEEDIRIRTSTQYVPGRYEESRSLKPVTRTTTQWKQSCRQVPHRTSRRVPQYRQQCGTTGYGSSSRYSCKSVTDYRTEYHTVYRNECRSTPHTATKTSYEYKTESRYVSGRTVQVSNRYAEWKLVASEPLCHELGNEPPSRDYIEGIGHLVAPKTTSL